MHGRNLDRLAWTLAATIGCLGSAVAWGQQEMYPRLPADAAYTTAADLPSTTPQVPAAENSLISGSAFNAAEKDLAADVAALKADMKKMKDKEEADKKKAADRPTFVLSGLIQFDWAVFDGKNAALLNSPLDDSFINGAEARRLRLQVSGEAFYVTDYKLEMEFASTSRPVFKDVYFTVKELPYIQNVRIGHHKEPFGLEQLTSDRYGTFMERSMLDEGFIVPSRNIGVTAFGWTENERATYAIGAFLTDTIDNPPIFPPPTALLPGGVTGVDDNSQTAMTMRGTWLPWYDECTEGCGLWHVGCAYSYRADEGYRNGANPVLTNYSVRPEAHLAPVILSTNALTALNNQLLGLETAFVYGPLSFQTEYYADFIRRPGAAKDVTFNGYYAYFSYFLTGEHRPYNRKAGCFDRVKPLTNFFRVNTCDGVQTGWGAWEIGYRWSYANMFDPNIVPTTVGLGRATDNTIGLNWYLTPYTRIMWNYIFTTFDRVDVAGAGLVPNHTVNTFEMRAQFDF